MLITIWVRDCELNCIALLGKVLQRYSIIIMTWSCLLKCHILWKCVSWFHINTASSDNKPRLAAERRSCHADLRGLGPGCLKNISSLVFTFGLSIMNLKEIEYNECICSVPDHWRKKADPRLQWKVKIRKLTGLISEYICKEWLC